MSKLKEMRGNQNVKDDGSPLYTILAVLALAVVALIIYFNFFSTASPSTIDQSSFEKAEHRRGNPNALVTVVEFADFQCPACGFAFTQFEKLVPEYKDRVEFVFMHYPLSGLHPFAYKAAEAVECASEQGKFWEMHDLMFAGQDKLQVSDLKGYALELGLDVSQFGQCLDSGKYSSKVAVDQSIGNSLGVSSTPTFFVNGEKYNNLTYEQWKNVLDSKLGQ